MALLRPTYTPVLGYAFPNSTDRIDVGSLALNSAGAAVAARIRITSIPARNREIIHVFDGLNNEPFYVGFQSSNTTLYCGGQGTNANWYSTNWVSGWQVGEYHQVIGIVNSSKASCELYVDGRTNPISTASFGSSIQTASCPAQIGNIYGLSRGFGGNIADLCFWHSGALPNALDINDYFNGVDPRLLRTRPTHYWPLAFDANDYIGSAHGTVTGATSGSFVGNRRRIPGSPGILYFLGTAGTTSYPLTASTGSFTLTGNAAALNYNRLITTTTGTFTLTGNAVNFLSNKVVTCNVGTFTETGNDANLLWGHVLSLTKGTFTFTGNDVTLTYSGTTERRLTADAGSFTLTGNAANLLFNEKLTVSTGTFTETGNDANLLFNRRLSCASGSFGQTGNDSNTLYDRVCGVVKGTFVMTGRNVNLIYSGAGGTALEILKLSRAQYMGVSEPTITTTDAGGGTYTVVVQSGESESKVDSVHYEGYKVNSGTELGS